MKKIIIGGIILVAIGGMVAINLLRADGSSTASIAGRRSQEVEARSVNRDTITSSIIITGTVEEVSEKSVVADSPIKVEEVFVKKGKAVKEGEIMFTVDTEDLQSELDQLNNSLEVQTLTLEKIHSMSAGTDDTSLEVALQMAKLSRESAQRSYDSHLADFEKNRTLFENGFISLSEFEALELGLTEAESQLQSAELGFQSSQAELSSLRQNNTEMSASTAYDVAIQEKTIEGMRMTIEDLEKQIADIEALATAPMDGVVTVLNIEEDEVASTMEPLVTITDTADLKIVASIREYDISEVTETQEVIITGDAIGKHNQVTGTVAYIAPVAEEAIVDNRQVTAVEVEITISEGVEFLKPGYTAECEIITSRLEDVVLVSYDMLTKSEKDEDMVFVIDAEGIARERIIELGATSDFDAEVISGLEAGEMVVISPSLSLFDGTKVEVIGEEEGE